MKCPYCQNIIDDDSRYCDQCGTQLMFCPGCAQPKKGSSCPRCGEMLIPGEKFFAGSGSNAGTPTPKPTPKPIDLDNMLNFDHLKSKELKLVGEGMNLSLKEGEFGRKCGVYPEFSSIPTISGRHGKIEKAGAAWRITDLGSTNGTYIDGQRLQAGKPYDLKEGMRVRIANLNFTVK